MSVNRKTQYLIVSRSFEPEDALTPHVCCDNTRHFVCIPFVYTR